MLCDLYGERFPNALSILARCGLWHMARIFDQNRKRFGSCGHCIVCCNICLTTYQKQDASEEGGDEGSVSKPAKEDSEELNKRKEYPPAKDAATESMRVS